MRNIITKKRLDKYAQLQKLIRKDPQYVLYKLMNGKPKAYVPDFWPLIGNYIYSSRYFKQMLWKQIGKCYRVHDVENVVAYSNWLGTIRGWDNDDRFRKSKAPMTYFFTEKKGQPFVPSENLINRLLVQQATFGHRNKYLYRKRRNNK